MMTRRAFCSSAATAEVSTPFWLSTFCTIAAALPEVACPSVRPKRATVQEPPAQQQKHPSADTKDTTGSPTGGTHETSSAAARAHFRERLGQLCDDRCHRRACSLSKTPCAIPSYPCRANAQVRSGHAHAHAHGDPCASGLKRGQLAAQCFAGARADLPNIVRKIFVPSVRAAGRRPTIFHNGLQARRTYNQLFYTVHCTTVKGR